MGKIQLAMSLFSHFSGFPPINIYIKPYLYKFIKNICYTIDNNYDLAMPISALPFPAEGNSIQTLNYNDRIKGNFPTVFHRKISNEVGFVTD